MALVQAALEQRDEAFATLERAVVERSYWLVWLRLDPRWSTIREDPRFEALARRIGL